MDLPNLFTKFKSTPEEIKQFLAVEIGLDAVKSAVWQVSHGQAQINNMGTLESWEKSNEDESLLLAIDKSVSAAVTDLDKEPDEVIFGLPLGWTSKDGITDTHKTTLKNLCQKLNFKPIGFVVTTEAVVHYLRETEGGPPSGVVVNLAGKEITVSLVRLGEIQGTHAVGKSNDLAADVEEGLARFPKSGDNLPSRIILYDGHHDLEAAKQELISHDWQKKLPFLHFPKIETLDADTTIKAIALGGGTEVAKSLGLLNSSATVPPPTRKTASAEEENHTAAPKMEKHMPTPQSLGEAGPVPKGADTDDFDFHEVTPEAPIVTTLADDNLVEPDEAETAAFVVHEGGKTTVQPREMEEVDEDAVVPLSSPSNLMAKITGFIPKISLPAMRIKLPRLPFSPLLIGLPGVIIVLIIMGIAYYQVPKAMVTVLIKPQAIEKEITFTVNPNVTETDVAGSVIPGAKEVVDVSGSGEVATTGTQTIGDKAKGTVSVYNRSTAPKTFPAGTAIATDAGLKFTLDTSVTIASASAKENADLSVTIQPSKGDVAVTAVTIGAQYNLGADTQLKVANFATDTYVAKVASGGLTGGSAKEVAAVDKTDQQKLEQQVLEQLKIQAANQLTAKLGNTQNVINTNQQEVVTEEYSAKVGEQANTLKLALSIRQTAYTYTPTDVTLLAQQSVVGSIPAGYSLQPNDTTMQVVNTQVNEDGTAQVSAKVSLKILPKLESKDIAKNLAGKSLSLAEGYLHGLPGYNKVEVKFTPQLPAFLLTFPHQVDNISVTVKSAQ